MKGPTIIEVIGRTAQGVSRPYLCRADDGQQWYVKHRALPARERVAEWVAAHLAHDAEWADLGAGTGFGSQAQLGREFQFSDVARVDRDLAARIAAFDWWIHNGDRSLTSLGGNPNLLWRTFEDGAGLVMIDHNLAFQPDFSARDLLQTHVFAHQFRHWLADFIAPEQMRQEFMRARGGTCPCLGYHPRGMAFR